MLRTFLPVLAVPLLLGFTGLFSYFTLRYDWNYEVVSYVIFLFTLVYILLLERIIPLKDKWRVKRTTFWVDIKHFIFSTAMFDILGKMMALSLVLYIQDHYFAVSGFWDNYPFLVTFIVANIIGDFFPYLYHRISHIGNRNSYISSFLWKTHAIHHLPEQLNWFKTNWIHPFNMLLNTLLKMIPILILGFSKDIIFLVGIAHVVIAYLSHANIRTRRSFWDYVIATPRIHHFHHSKKIAEAKNFGNILPFWDLLLGTYYNRKGDVDEVGLIEDSDAHYPNETSFFKQLLFPLTTYKDCCKV